MISKFRAPREAYVWIWLPGESQPVVAGKLEAHAQDIRFNYGKSYLERIHDENPAIPIYLPELPLQQGAIPLKNNLNMPACIRDASPDAWGRRVVINKVIGIRSKQADAVELPELSYLLESGSDRIGALDFQESPTEYIPRDAKNASLEELIESAERVEKGVPLSKELGLALYHGTAIGGARPKALVEDKEGNKKFIAKFSSSTDIYSVVKAEYIAMKLAGICGLNVASTKLVKAANKDVLLIERFDREKKNGDWTRKAMVSALTLFELDDMTARYASYEELADIIRHRFTEPKKTLTELFCRLVFNILCGNTDDHARNHAAFWNGEYLTLTPAYDICPQGRAGGEASQAMLIRGGNNLSHLKNCVEAAPGFQLREQEAKKIIDEQIQTIEENWSKVCDEAELEETDRKLFWRRQFLNPFVFEG